MKTLEARVEDLEGAVKSITKLLESVAEALQQFGSLHRRNLQQAIVYESIIAHLISERVSKSTGKPDLVAEVFIDFYLGISQTVATHMDLAVDDREQIVRTLSRIARIADALTPQPDRK